MWKEFKSENLERHLTYNKYLKGSYDSDTLQLYQLVALFKNAKLYYNHSSSFTFK